MRSSAPRGAGLLPRRTRGGSAVTKATPGHTYDHARSLHELRRERRASRAHARGVAPHPPRDHRAQALLARPAAARAARAALRDLAARHVQARVAVARRACEALRAPALGVEV